MDEIQLEMRKFLAPEFVFGVNSINLAGQYAKNYGAQKVFIVTDPGIIEAGWVSKVEASLHAKNIEYYIFSTITENPKDFEVMEGATLYSHEKCDIIVAIGGGSPMDCAKGIGAVVSNKKHILEFEGVDEVVLPSPPLICIPTTAGTSADVSQFSIITDTTRKVKIAIISKTMVPDISLIDPMTTTTMDKQLTAATGMDAFVHAFEAYVSNASSPITDIHALKAIDIIHKNILTAVEQPHHIHCKSNMMLASLLAGLAFSNASLGLVHSMAHALGGYSGLAHGLCNAILLEYVVDFNFDSEPERYTTIAKTMGIDIQDNMQKSIKKKLVETIVQMRKTVGIHQNIEELGVKLTDIPQLAKFAYNDPCLATNPKKVVVKEIEEIYEKNYSSGG